LENEVANANSIWKLNERTVVQQSLSLDDIALHDAIAGLNRACDMVEESGPDTVLLLQLSGAASQLAALPADVHEVNHWERALRRIERLGSVIVATLDGVAGPAAFAVLLTADYRIMAPAASLGLLGRQGILPDTTLFRLANQLGVAQARRIGLFGMPLAAADAQRLALADELNPSPLAAAKDFIGCLQAAQTRDVAVRRRLLLDASAISYEDGLGVHLAACDRFIRAARADLADAADHSELPQ
jgi:isomerase DpgB